MELRSKAAKYLDIHHTSGHEPNTEAVRQEHKAQGWEDIGYNWVVEPNGTVGAGRDPKYVGAHDLGVAHGETLSMNRLAIGMVFIGDFEEGLMGEVQLQSGITKAVELCQQYSIPLDRIRKHKDQYATDCPGKNFPWDRFISEIKGGSEGGNDVLGVAVLLNTKEDFWAGNDVAVKNINCAVFIRSTFTGAIPSDAMSAKKLIVVGGPTTGHPSEVLLSGNDKYDTAAAVAKYLG